MGHIPVRAFLPLTMQELAIHGWDIRSRLETAAPLSAESLPVLMTRIPARFGVPGYATFRLAARAPIPIRYRFALTGAVPSTHDIVVENEQARMEPAGTATPHVTFHCATDIFVLMMYRRLTLEPALAAGQLAVEGDQGLTAAFDRWLKGA
jgi:SCP-2 sterol transfer family